MSSNVKTNDPIICAVCNKSYSKYSIGAHVKNKHNIDPVRYKVEQGLMADPDVPIMVKCVNCDTQFEKNKGQKYCSNICKTNHKNKEKYRNNLINCPYCDWTGRTITRHLRTFHPEVSIEEYKKEHGSLWCDDSREDMSKRLKGENNPGYKHCGKFSPFSSKFVGYKNLDKDEIKEKVKEVVSKAKNSRDLSGGVNTRLEYWIKWHGMSEEEAIIALSERQSTFSLKKCIDKYGVEEGKRIWADRQTKWQETLNSKTAEELIAINKSKRLPREKNYKCFKNLSKREYVLAHLYVLELVNGNIKIGITSKKSVFLRYTNDDINHLTVQKWESKRIHASCAFLIEQILIEKLKIHRINSDSAIDPFGWHEVFCGISFDDTIKLINNKIDLSKDEIINIYESVKGKDLNITNLEQPKDQVTLESFMV